MERTGINQLQVMRNAFKRLKRQINARKRKGDQVDETMMLKLQDLDTWLCKNDKTWHTNFPKNPTNPTV
jgi:hypothetical protein